jgi:predicted nucleic-acid-binding protein
VKHSTQGRVSMYVDHSNWEKSRQTTHNKGMKGAKSKELDECEMSEWETGMNSMIIDSSNMFMLDQQQSTASGSMRIFGEAEAGHAKQSQLQEEKQGAKEVTEENMFEKLKQGITVLRSKEISMKTKSAELTSNKHYEKGLKKTTQEHLQNFVKVLEDLENAVINRKAKLMDCKKKLHFAKELVNAAALHMKILSAL